MGQGGLGVGGGGKCRDGGDDPESTKLQKPKEKWFSGWKPARLCCREREVRPCAEGRCSERDWPCGVLVQRGGHKSFANMAFLFLII